MQKKNKIVIETNYSIIKMGKKNIIYNHNCQFNLTNR